MCIIILCTCTGNHTFAAIRGKESYELLSTAFSELIQNINETIDSGKLAVGGTDYELKFLLGGDYKVIMESNHNE